MVENIGVPLDDEIEGDDVIEVVDEESVPNLNELSPAELVAEYFGQFAVQEAELGEQTLTKAEGTVYESTATGMVQVFAVATEAAAEIVDAGLVKEGKYE